MADLPLFQVRSRADDFLQSLFPPPPSKKQVNTKNDPVWLARDDALDKLRAEYSTIEPKLISTPVQPVGMPLNFPTLEDEIGFTFVNEALRFGSRYDALLAENAKRINSAREAVQFGLMGAYISSKSLHLADELLAICDDVHAIGRVFDFPVHKNEALDFAKLGGVYKEVNGPLYPFAQLLGRVMNEMALLCRSRGMPSLGHFALSIKVKTVSEFAEYLARALPLTFGADEARAKALRLGSQLALRFPQKFDFDLNHGVPAIVDAELVLALRKLNVLCLSADLEQRIDVKRQVLPAHDVALLCDAAALAMGELNAIRGDLATDWILAKAEAEPPGRQQFQHLFDTTAY